MSKVNASGRVPRQYDPSTIASIFRDIENQLNGISEGKVYATYNAHTAAPTGSAQSYQRGDFVKNTQPSEVTQTFIGSYVIAGWLNTSAGSPGTWKQCRFLTTDITLDSDGFTGTEWTDLTDGGATILHKHDHGGMDGLADDDHTQYLLHNGTRSLTADWDAGSFEIRAQTFESDVATGTAPLVIASTTKVTNLNADLLDDQSGAYYLDSANFTGANWTDLTDGGTTTLHTHTSGVASSITVANEAVDTTCFPVFVTAATGDLGPKSNASLAFDSSNGALTIGTKLTIGSSQVLTTRQTGWAAPSSTLARTTFATYPGQTITDNYGNLGTLFTQVQTIDDHVKVVSQRLGALITDLITHGLIGT